MEIKLKENINVESFVFRKRVLEEAIDLLAEKDNYTDTDLSFILMITFVNNLVEDNLIIETLSDENEVESRLKEIVEPLYFEEIVNKSDRQVVFEALLTQLREYKEREFKSLGTVGGFLNKLAKDLGALSIEDIGNLVTNLITSINFEETKKANNKVIKYTPEQDLEIKDKVVEGIQNEKMRALMEKYARPTTEEEDAE